MTFWTAEREARLFQMRVDKKTYSEIALELGCTRDAAIGRGRRLGAPSVERNAPERLADPNVPKPYWTPTREQYLRAAWTEGKSASEIAKELGGTTRLAVIGKAHRLKLARRAGLESQPACYASLSKPRQNPPKPGQQNRPGAVFGPVSVLSPEETDKRRQEQRAEGAAIIARVANDQTVESPDARPFLEAKGGCKWPLGSGAGMLVCCNPITRGSYCEGHGAIAYIGKPVDPRAARKAAQYYTRHERAAEPKPKRTSDGLWDEAA